MKINRLTLENWRNYKEAELEFCDGQNLLFGENAQGKTNLLEAVFYLSCLKTFRSRSDFDAVKTGESAGKINASFSAYGRELELSCTVNKSGRKLFVNGIPEKSPRNHIGLIKTVVFSPDDLQLIKEGPDKRRRFMNLAISQMRPSYVKALSELNKIIESKRKILKLEEGRESYIDFLDVLNEKLARVSAYITYERGEFLKMTERLSNSAIEKISRGGEELSLSYNCDSSVTDTADENNFKTILEHLNRRKQAELASGMCLVGAQRDDFTVYINGKSARDFGSQGQIRSCVLALKCAEHEIIEQDSGEKPILLLDDVLSELDPSRREFLINGVDRGQTIITGCDPSMFSELKNGKIFTIEKGNIIDKIEN